MIGTMFVATRADGDTSDSEREGVFGQAHHWYWNLGMRVKFPTGMRKRIGDGRI